MLKCVTCVAIPFVVTVPNKWRKTGHVFAISTGGQEWVSVETVYSQNDGRHNSQAPGLCFSRDVLLEDIRQHIVHNCQEIEQLCGLCPVKLEQGDVLQHKSVCPEKEILCACGQQLLCWHYSTQVTNTGLKWLTFLWLLQVCWVVAPSAWL